MSQRNPLNERYQTDKHQGVSRKSAASAKPKAAAAASVTYGSPKKTPKDRKAEQKAIRKEEAARQREIDRKYYTPDTQRYKKLRRLWWMTLIGAVAFTAASWFLRGIQPEWLAVACLVVAYVLIILAFFIDFSKIRKERKAYQTRMIALEVEQKKQAEREARAKKANQPKSTKGAKGKGKQMTAAAKRAASSASNSAGSDKGKNQDSEGAEKTTVESASETTPKKKRFFKRKDESSEGKKEQEPVA